MINVLNAKELILSKLPQLGIERKSLIASVNHILAKDIISNVDLPHFDNSAVDGYGINSKHYLKNKHYSVDVEISAGSNYSGDLNNNSAVRIFTGAPIPSCVDTIIMQEYVTKNNDGTVCFDDEYVKPGHHIRKQGEQLIKGNRALSAGNQLNPFTIGFLANLGLSEVDVYLKPIIGMVISGSELVQVGEILKPGQIYESNGIMLRSALLNYGFDASYDCVGDNKTDLDSSFKKALIHNDVVIFTGGASVGDYDFTAEIIEDNGFTIAFNRINQKPGKPMIFAYNENKIVFGLPGNPRAAFVCFYEYVLPAIKSMMGAQRPFLETIRLPIKHDYDRKNDKKTYFLNASFDHDGVQILNKQQSDMLKTTAVSNCIAILNGDQTHINKNELIEVHILPTS